jgi:EAL domain-containing protein (putative c-di-GMP-specific phosphodiesterase class I)
MFAYGERRLLILDDDPEIGRTISFIAESIGVSARHTASPSEFFALQLTWAPTHVAIDLVMPEMDGVQVLAQLAHRHCTAQIIITSGLGERVLAAAGRSAEEHGLKIAGVLSKPFSPLTLRKLLSKPAAPDAATQPVAVAHPRSTPFVPTFSGMLEALEGNQLQVYYQPKLSCKDQSLSGFEALVRWNHPLHGVIGPDNFIPFAEAQGLITALTECVVDQALTWFSGWSATHVRAASVPPVTISINLSAKSLKEERLVDDIVRKCTAHAVDPGRVVFELTETSAMVDPTASLDLLTRLRLKGFQLSIDDFGTGFSSMLQLARLPFSEIKVDRSFVISASHSIESRAVIRSIVDLGRSLGMKATAEGVEDAVSLSFLNHIGCDEVQGYYFARPMPAEAIPGWIAGWKPRPES